jgi:hypothetical protein
VGIGDNLVEKRTPPIGSSRWWWTGACMPTFPLFTHHCSLGIGYLDRMNIHVTTTFGSTNLDARIDGGQSPSSGARYTLPFTTIHRQSPPCRRRRRSDRRCAYACMHEHADLPACAQAAVVADTTAAKLASQDRRGLVRREGRRSTATRARRTQNIQWWTHPMANWPIRVGKCAAA